MNDRDRRQRETVKSIEHGVTACDESFDFCRVGNAAEFIDIGAGDEAALFGRADDEPRWPILFDFVSAASSSVSTSSESVFVLVSFLSSKSQTMPFSSARIFQCTQETSSFPSAVNGPSSRLRLPRTSRTGACVSFISVLRSPRSASPRPDRRRCTPWRCPV